MLSIQYKLYDIFILPPINVFTMNVLTRVLTSIYVLINVYNLNHNILTCSSSPVSLFFFFIINFPKKFLYFYVLYSKIIISTFVKNK